MELSVRMSTISSMIDKCNCCADIGTDHGYIPIYLVKNNICNRVIASDINKGPIEKATFNIKLKNLEDKIDCRIGPGFTTLKQLEANSAIIAGMGGNLIRDIIEDGIDIFKTLDYLVVQPVQNTEVLREYIYKKGYYIVDEELCIDENKFYEIIKIRYDNNHRYVDNIFYEISKKLIDKKHPLIGEFIQFKLNKYEKILSYIKEDTESAEKRRIDVSSKIIKLKELLKCI